MTSFRFVQIYWTLYQYGRFEIRAKIPTASGSWPAIWTLGKYMPWPSNGEIDIMEYYPIKGIPHILANTAWGTDQVHHAKWDSKTVPLSEFTDKDPDWASKFHIWRMDWDETAIRLYLDNELLNETLLSETVNGSFGNYSNPFKQPHYILLNLAIGGGNGGTPDDAAFPLKYEIDYVRVYQKVNCKSQQTYNNIISGVPWFDQNNNIINAHGACIVEDSGRYYLFGEYKSDTANVFTGFSCYSSADLVNWQFERIVLPQQKDGLLGPKRVGERVKVMRCPSTGEYVMYMHCDDTGYYDPHIGYATCKTVNGDYEFQGALLYKGQPVKCWDMGTYQDSDGEGYLLIHHGDIYRLSDDYKSAEKLPPHIRGMGESPAMFKKDGVYFLLSSNLTSWERNDNKYHTANNIEVPWTEQGLFAPEGSLTYNSQCSFVFVPKSSVGEALYMGDRWSFPKQGSCATYVWLPLHVEGTKLTLQKPENAMLEGKNLLEKPFVSNTKNDFVTVEFSGRQIAVYGESNAHGGYGRVTITDKNGNTVISSLVDFYSKVPDTAIRYISPKLPKGNYTLKVEVTGENSTWSDKKMSIFYGSDDCFINVNKIITK